jgi:hypothetical protein
MHALNQCHRSSSSYNPALAESEPQHTLISPVGIVPLPKKKVGQRGRTMGKEAGILTSSPFRNQLDASLKGKWWKTGNLIAEATRTDI